MYIDAIVEGINWNTFVFHAHIQQYDEAQLRFSPTQSNCAWWLLGHVVVHRPMMVKALGDEPQMRSYEDQFGYGSAGEYAEDWTDVTTLLSDLKTTGEELIIALESASDEQLAEKVPYIGGNKEVTRIANLMFMFWHESYHSGQLAMISKMLGYDRFA